MWPYWVLFAVPAFAELARPASNHARTRVAGTYAAWVATGVWLTVMIGFRYEVGGDWFNYLNYLDIVHGAPLRDVITLSDPGYTLLNWISVALDWGVLGVNVVSAAIFTIGLIAFCRTLPRPWLALTVAVPYLVIVVGMGYTRQGLALGLAMLALPALARGRTLYFVFWVAVATTFHRSAILLLPIAALATTRNRYWTAAWVGVISIVGYHLLVEQTIGTLYENYIVAQYASQGALIRLLMNALPAAILLIWRARFASMGSSLRLWLLFAGISFVLLAAYFTTPATTAVDRIALYMLPLQLAVFAHVPNAFAATPRDRRQLTAVIVLYYAAVLFVWLTFATHAFAWVPYRFYLLEG